MKSSNDNGGNDDCKVVQFPTDGRKSDDDDDCACASCQTNALIEDISELLVKHGIVESYDNGRLVVNDKPTAQAYYVMVNALFMRAASIEMKGDIASKVDGRLEALFHMTETYADLTMREAAKAYAYNKEK